MPHHSRIKISDAAESLGKESLPKREKSSREVVYTVKSGDTLSEIAEKFHISTKELIRRNGKTEDDSIKIGEKLLIAGVPVRRGSHFSEAAASRHVTIRGEQFEYCPKLSTAFFSKLTKVALALGTKPEFILGIIFHETAGTMHPGCLSGSSSAVGLLQWTKSGRESIGVTKEQLAGMSREKQLSYVYKYLAPFKGRIDTLGDLYMAVIRPGSVGAKNADVVFREGNSYFANASLDSNNNGVITKSEIVAKVTASYRAACKVYGKVLAAVKSRIRAV